ncbi:MAG: HAD hydrolase-like protein [Ignavibacteriaceae bacterium]|nr:HAD hydrolase-like protein [Ignavibacteriaceae bacterium]
MYRPLPFLIDFDGVINLYGEPAPHSKKFLDFIFKHNLPAFILSNSTLRAAKDVKGFLEKHDLFTKIPIMTAADAALKYVENNYKRISVYCVENVKKEFEKFLDDNNPQAVVVGDLVEGWSVEILNEIFLKVKNGADLIAMHMNRYWSPQKDKFVLDAGSFISAIEYATEKKAVLLGKPSSIYFQSALDKLGYSADTPFLMLGDDLEMDISPAQKMGGKTILILTGKTKFPITASITPDFIANDLSDVVDILSKIYSI